MSFILEALRKSEAERRSTPAGKGAAPGVYVVAQPRGRSTRSWLVPVAALAAGIGVAVTWDALAPVSDAPAPAVALPQPRVQEARATGEPLSPPAARPGDPAAAGKGDRGATPLPASTPARSSAPKTVEAPIPVAVALVRPPVKTVVAALAVADKGANIGRDAKKAAAPDVPPPAIAASAASAAVRATPPQPAATAQYAAPSPAPTAVTVAEVPTAPAVIDEPPKLTISGFANSDDTRARFAVIDNRIVREGELFAPDLRLVQVGDDGVVVEYKGRRYRP